MRRWVAIGAVLTLMLGACDKLAPGQTGARRPVTPKASVRPATKPSLTPATTVPSPNASRKPSLLEGPTATLKGVIEIDAHYIVANNAGSLVSNNGSSVIALKGGQLISDNGLGLISDNGLGLISDNGLGLISDNGLGYRIMAGTDVKVGTILPVKGMAVFPISMRTGEIVGKPVITDAQGGYTLTVPEAVKGNLRLVARVPVATKDDPIAKAPRAQYNLVVEAAPEQKAERTFDEDTSVGTRYLRASFAGRLKELITAPDGDQAAAVLVKALGFDAGVKQFLSASVVELNQAAKDAGVPAMKPEELNALAERLTDILISYVPVYTVEIDPIKYGKTGPKEPAFLGMVDVLKRVREGAAVKLQADPKAYDNAPWMEGAQYPRTIKKPTDVCDFVVDNYMTGLSGELTKTRLAFAAAGVEDSETQARRINTLAIGILANVGQTLITTPEAKAEMIAAIKATKK